MQNLREQPVNRLAEIGGADNCTARLNGPRGRQTAPNSFPDFLSVRQPEAENHIKKILVATDFSPPAAAAVDHAVTLANRLEAKLTILHVIDINTQAHSGPADQLMQRVWAEGSARMGKLACSLRGQTEAQTVIQEGLVWEEIVEQSRDFDLVVLGGNRAKARWNLFSKQTAQRVVDKAACPVLVVPEEAAEPSVELS